MSRLRRRTGCARTQKCAKTNRQPFFALVGWRHKRRGECHGPEGRAEAVFFTFPRRSRIRFGRNRVLRSPGAASSPNLVFTWREFNPTNSSTRFFSNDEGASFRVRDRCAESTRRSPPLSSRGSPFRTVRRSWFSWAPYLSSLKLLPTPRGEDT